MHVVMHSGKQTKGEVVHGLMSVCAWGMSHPTPDKAQWPQDLALHQGLKDECEPFL